MTSALAVTRIHLVRRHLSFTAPAGTVAVTLLVSMLVSAIFVRFGATAAPDFDPNDANPAMAWALPGFFGYLGVTMVATSFPFGLAVGATRRAFVGGTLITYAALAAYAAVLLTGLLIIERATGHWFVNVHVMDTVLLGSGSPLLCALIAFLGSMSIFSLGGVFAAAWIRFRGWGTAGLAIGTVLVIGGTLLVFGARIVDLFAGFRPWWLAVGAVALIAAACAGTYLFLRRATVR